MASRRGPGRTGHNWRKVSERLKRELPPVCWICGDAIDMTLHVTDAMSWTLDHIVSLSEGGAPEDPANLRPAHRRCNSKRNTGGPGGGMNNNHKLKPRQSRRW